MKNGFAAIHIENYIELHLKSHSRYKQGGNNYCPQGGFGRL